jgi:hypothetical protein
MANVYAFAKIVPVVDPDSYVHPTATLIGDDVFDIARLDQAIVDAAGNVTLTDGTELRWVSWFALTPCAVKCIL